MTMISLYCSRFNLHVHRFDWTLHPKHWKLQGNKWIYNHLSHYDNIICIYIKYVYIFCFCIIYVYVFCVYLYMHLFSYNKRLFAQRKDAYYMKRDRKQANTLLIESSIEKTLVSEFLEYRFSLLVVRRSFTNDRMESGVRKQVNTFLGLWSFNFLKACFSNILETGNTM